MEDFIIDDGVDLKGVEAEVCGGEKEEEESGCLVSALSSSISMGMHGFKLTRCFEPAKGSRMRMLNMLYRC